jgi:hypothetical protein
LGKGREGQPSPIVINHEHTSPALARREERYFEIRDSPVSAGAKATFPSVVYHNGRRKNVSGTS